MPLEGEAESTCSLHSSTLKSLGSIRCVGSCYASMQLSAAADRHQHARLTGMSEATTLLDYITCVCRGTEEPLNQQLVAG